MPHSHNIGDHVIIQGHQAKLVSRGYDGRFFIALIISGPHAGIREAFHPHLLCPHCAAASSPR